MLKLQLSQYFKVFMIPSLKNNIFLILVFLIIMFSLQSGQQLIKFHPEFERGAAEISFEDVEQDYYAILGLTEMADLSQIKKAYKNLILQWHPDKNFDNPEEAESMTKKLNNAYKILNDPVKKKEYDKQRLEYKQTMESSMKK